MFVNGSVDFLKYSLNIIANKFRHCDREESGGKQSVILTVIAIVMKQSFIQ
jgi:hypothetical protein